MLLPLTCYSQKQQDSLYVIWENTKLADTTRANAYRGFIYKNYFEIFIISPTAAELDDQYGVLGLPKTKFFYPNIKVIRRIFDIQKDKIKKHGISSVKPVLIVIDDAISYKKFINHKDFLKLFVMGRHLLCSVIVTSQAYHRLPKSCRLQCSAISFFRGSQKEVETIVDDYAPAGMSKRTFYRVVDRATDQPYSFLMIDLASSVQDGRYRRNFEERVV